MEGKEYNDWKNFGIRVKNARNSIGMTVEKLAEKTDRTENFIFKIESGQSCSIHTVHQLSQVLKIPADDLLYGIEMEEKNYTDKEILQNIISRCNEKELKIIRDVIVAMYPHFKDIN